MILAGPMMNVLLAVAIVAGLYMYAFPREIESADPVITSLAPGSPAANAGLQPGDKIIQIGNKRDPNWQDVLTQEALNANYALPVKVDRKGAHCKSQSYAEDGSQRKGSAWRVGMASKMCRLGKC